MPPTLQDEIVQNSHVLSFNTSHDPERTGTATIALLRNGCGLTDDSEVAYSAGALDETYQYWVFCISSLPSVPFVPEFTFCHYEAG